MGRVHLWGPESRATIADSLEPSSYYLELRATDDEANVQVWWADRMSAPDTWPDFVVAPHVFDSRTNSVIAANVRRMLPKDTLVAVMIHGRKRRERMDMCHWLIENEYLPMFPRSMASEATPSVPLMRHQLLHEMRPIIDREAGQLFICHSWGTENTAREYIESTQGNWELLG